MLQLDQPNSITGACLVSNVVLRTHGPRIHCRVPELNVKLYLDCNPVSDGGNDLGNGWTVFNWTQQESRTYRSTVERWTWVLLVCV
jgi:hypothetical protein